MSRNVRNFWIEVEVDGRRTRISAGPKSKDGGLSVRLFQRDRGEVREVLTIRSTVEVEGRLLRTVVDDLESVVSDGNGTISTVR